MKVAFIAFTRRGYETMQNLAVNMALTTANGWVFSDEELKSWLVETGFEPGEAHPVPPPMPHWVLSAVKR